MFHCIFIRCIRPLPGVLVNSPELQSQVVELIFFLSLQKIKRKLQAGWIYATVSVHFFYQAFVHSDMKMSLKFCKIDLYSTICTYVGPII